MSSKEWWDALPRSMNSHVFKLEVSLGNKPPQKSEVELLKKFTRIFFFTPLENVRFLKSL